MTRMWTVTMHTCLCTCRQWRIDKGRGEETEHTYCIFNFRAMRATQSREGGHWVGVVVGGHPSSPGNVGPRRCDLALTTSCDLSVRGHANRCDLLPASVPESRKRPGT